MKHELTFGNEDVTLRNSEATFSSIWPIHIEADFSFFDENPVKTEKKSKADDLSTTSSSDMTFGCEPCELDGVDDSVEVGDE